MPSTTSLLPPLPVVPYEGPVVLADGRVSRCCFDADGSGVIANVMQDLTRFQTSPYHLCKKCHLKQPAGVADNESSRGVAA